MKRDENARQSNRLTTLSQHSRRRDGTRSRGYERWLCTTGVLLHDAHINRLTQVTLFPNTETFVEFADADAIKVRAMLEQYQISR